MSTAAEVYHEIGNALSVLVPKLRLLKKHFEQINELLAEFRKIDSDAPPMELKEGVLRCRKLAESGFGIDRHLKKVAGAFDPCFRELEVVKIASEYLRGRRADRSLGVTVDGRKALESIIALYREHLREVEGIQIVFGVGYSKADDSPIEIASTPDEFSYILKNLVLNAVDAINEKKRQGKYKRGDDLKIEVDVGRDVDGRDGYARITCRDNGIGMDKALRGRIFDSFFTTKLSSKGTGVGLSIVKEVIEERGGTIGVESVEEEWTEFVIDLPLSARGSDGK